MKIMYSEEEFDLQLRIEGNYFRIQVMGLCYRVGYKNTSYSPVTGDGRTFNEAMEEIKHIFNTEHLFRKNKK